MCKYDSRYEVLQIIVHSEDTQWAGDTGNEHLWPAYHNLNSNEPAKRRTIHLEMSSKSPLCYRFHSLQKFISVVTVCRIGQARKHCLEVGQAQPLDLQHVKKLKLNDGKVDHFMDLFSQQFLKYVMDKTTNFDGRSNGDRNFVSFYQAHCDEINYDHLVRSSLFSII